MTFSGVASNFAGVPLALAFIFTLGFQGLVTTFLQDTFGFDLYASDRLQACTRSSGSSSSTCTSSSRSWS